MIEPPDLRSTALTASGSGHPEEPVEDEFLIGGNERRAKALAGYESSSPGRFQDKWEKITTVLGIEAIGIEHIGFTAVRSLAAKPIIDVLVTVAGIKAEPHYLPAFQRAGHVLRVREPGHRIVRTPGLDAADWLTVPWPRPAGAARRPLDTIV